MPLSLVCNSNIFSVGASVDVTALTITVPKT